jgi:tripartite-type tricarboxylate transporter receptor subunit TctC
MINSVSNRPGYPGSAPPRPPRTPAQDGASFDEAAARAAKAKRAKVAPDVPTMAESGFPGFEVTSWYALLVPAGTPAAIVNRMREEAGKALQRPDVLQVMAGQGLEAETSTPKELASRIAADRKTWAEVVKAAGIKAE